MNGADIKKAAINKAKQVAQAANGNGGKKRRKQDLKPIITNSESQNQDSPTSTSTSTSTSTGFHYKCVHAVLSPAPLPWPPRLL